MVPKRNCNRTSSLNIISPDLMPCSKKMQISKRCLDVQNKKKFCTYVVGSVIQLCKVCLSQLKKWKKNQTNTRSTEKLNEMYLYVCVSYQRIFAYGIFSCPVQTWYSTLPPKSRNPILLQFVREVLHGQSYLQTQNLSLQFLPSPILFTLLSC